MIGRGHDREEVLRLIGANGTVTVTGPGGVGKTRLVLDVAADPATGAGAGRGRRPGRGGQPRSCLRRGRLHARAAHGRHASGPAEVAAALADRDLLLVLDNCEHLADACRELVTTVRRQAPRVRVLATSRVTLQVPGEYVVRLQPLPVPRETTDLDGAAATARRTRVPRARPPPAPGLRRDRR